VGGAVLFKQTRKKVKFRQETTNKRMNLLQPANRWYSEEREAELKRRTDEGDRGCAGNVGRLESVWWGKVCVEKARVRNAGV